MIFGPKTMETAKFKVQNKSRHSVIWFGPRVQKLMSKVLVYQSLFQIAKNIVQLSWPCRQDFIHLFHTRGDFTFCWRFFYRGTLTQNWYASWGRCWPAMHDSRIGINCRMVPIWSGTRIRTLRGMLELESDSECDQRLIPILILDQTGIIPHIKSVLCITDPYVHIPNFSRYTSNCDVYFLMYLNYFFICFRLRQFTHTLKC